MLNSPSDNLPPDWLEDAAKALSPAAGFEERCVDASLAAYTIAKLAIEREQCGFVPVTIEQYLSSLANRAGVDLDPLLRWAHLPSLAATASTAAPLGFVIRAIGSKLEDALMLIRLSWAEQLGFSPLPMLVSYRGRMRQMDDFALCGEVLGEAEAGYSEPDRLTLGAILDSVRDAFGRGV